MIVKTCRKILVALKNFFFFPVPPVDERAKQWFASQGLKPPKPPNQP
jgi:hypothetical protein